MKLLPHIQTRLPRTMISGFTLAEAMIAVTIFTLVIAATVSMQVFGLRIYTLAATKLSATAGARKTLNDIRDQIRAARSVDVGNYTLSYGSIINHFSVIPNGSPQQGNALRIYSTTNTSATAPCTYIFLQPSAGGTNFMASGNTNSLILQTYSNGVQLTSSTVANYITNQIIFQAQDFENPPVVLTNNVNNRIIQIQLYFSQWEYPIAVIGTKEFNAYDYYRLQTRVTRRDID